MIFSNISTQLRKLTRQRLFTGKVPTVLCFYSKQVFGPHTAKIISTDLDRILHTPTVVRNTLVGRLRPRSASGRLQAKPERLFFC